MDDTVEKWLLRAESSFKLGSIKNTEGIMLEDLCYQLQQACEKAVKALIIYNGIEPKKTHSFNILLQQVGRFMEVPSLLQKVLIMENYAIQTRYPGDYSPVDNPEYEEALLITENVFSWIRTKIQ